MAALDLLIGGSSADKQGVCSVSSLATTPSQVSKSGYSKVSCKKILCIVCCGTGNQIIFLCPFVTFKCVDEIHVCHIVLILYYCFRYLASFHPHCLRCG